MAYRLDFQERALAVNSSFESANNNFRYECLSGRSFLSMGQFIFGEQILHRLNG